MIRMIDPFKDMCPFCLELLRRGAVDDGQCGHEFILERYPHLRFNAVGRVEDKILRDSETRFRAAYCSAALRADDTAEFMAGL